MDNQEVEGRSVFTASIKGLAVVGGVIAAFFLTPGLYDWSVPAVEAFTADHYGEGWGDAAAIVWFGVVGVGVYFGVSAGLSMALMATGLALASLFR